MGKHTLLSLIIACASCTHETRLTTFSLEKASYLPQENIYHINPDTGEIEYIPRQKANSLYHPVYRPNEPVYTLNEKSGKIEKVPRSLLYPTQNPVYHPEEEIYTLNEKNGKIERKTRSAAGEIIKP